MAEKPNKEDQATKDAVDALTEALDGTENAPIKAASAAEVPVNENLPDDGATHTVETTEIKPVAPSYYDANKGIYPRVGGPFYDEVQGAEAEVRRAAREGRTPDFTAVQPSVGDPLVLRQTLLNSPAIVQQDNLVTPEAAK